MTSASLAYRVGTNVRSGTLVSNAPYIGNTGHRLHTIHRQHCRSATLAYWVGTNIRPATCHWQHLPDRVGTNTLQGQDKCLITNRSATELLMLWVGTNIRSATLYRSWVGTLVTGTTKSDQKTCHQQDFTDRVRTNIRSATLVHMSGRDTCQEQLSSTLSIGASIQSHI